jgi:hypothetical protein
MKTIALVDYFNSGHHTMFIKLYAKALIRLGYMVFLFFPESEEIRAFIKENKHIIHVPTAQRDTRRSEINVLRNWFYIKKLLTCEEERKKISFDFVFFAWLDSFLYSNIPPLLLDFIFPYKWSGIYFHPLAFRFDWTSLSKCPYQWTQECLLRSTNCTGVAVLDEGVKNRLEKRIHKNVYVFPDVTDESKPSNHFSLIKKIKQEAKGRPIITALGAIAKRKNQLLLLRTSLLLKANKYFFVFVGKISPTLSKDDLQFFQDSMNSLPSNCLFSFKKIPKESQFNSLVNVSDILYFSYLDFPHSSNLLTKASFYQKPVIVSNKYCLSERVQRYHLGECISGRNPKELLSAIDYIVRNKRQYHTNKEFQTYRKLHSFDVLVSALGKLMSDMI